MRLDSRYFDRIATTRHNGALLESYKCVHARSTMVLFSRKSHTPLAALTLKAGKDIGCLSMLTGRPSPKNSTQPYFQGMLSMPESFSFVVTNLADAGMVNFNVLHTPHRVSEVDPGPSYGVNEVNELHANQSYDIEADQRTNRGMVLKGKAEVKFDPTTKQSKVVPLSVDESESTEDKAKEGLYFYLSVVPDSASPKLVEKFKEGTVWKAVAGFVRQVPWVQPYDSNPIMPPLIRPPPPELEALDDMPLPYFAASTAPSRPFRLPRPSFRSLRGNLTRPTLPQTSIFERLCASSMAPAASRSGTGNFIAGSASFLSRAPPPTSSSAPPAAAFQGSAFSSSAPSTVASQRSSSGLSTFLAHDAQDEDDFAYLGESMPVNCKEKVKRRIFPEDDPGNNGEGSFTAPVNVGSTQAGELSYGDRIKVQSRSTGHEYAYECTSEPTVLCMSIWDGMKFLPLLDTVEKMLEAEVKELIDNEGKALIESLNAVFKEEKCVIDLESEADTIICTCGHQCINHANVSNDLRCCPLCRTPVTAFVRADGIVM